MKFFTLAVLLSFSTSFAASWWIQDSVQNITLDAKSMSYKDTNFVGFMSNSRCLGGSIADAFKSLSISGDSETDVTKERYSSKGVVLTLNGPICSTVDKDSAYPGEGPTCLDYKKKKRSFLLKACDPNQAYFTQYESPVVPFQQTISVVSKSSNKALVNEYYEGAFQLLLEPSYGILKILLKDWRYSLDGTRDTAYRTISLILNPNVTLKGKKQEFSSASSDLGRSTECSVVDSSSKPSTHILISCETERVSIGTIALPNWIFTQINDKTLFETVHTSSVPQVSIGTKKGFVTSNPSSVSELWETLYSAGAVQGCLNSSYEDALDIANSLQSCGSHCAKSILYEKHQISHISVDPKSGILVSREQRKCVLEAPNEFNRGSYGKSESSNYDFCIKYEVSNDIVQIPLCSQN